MRKYFVKDGNIITRERLIKGGAICVVDGKIEAVYESLPENIGEDYKIISAEGNYVSPGFIDIHVHGGNNSDFLMGDAEKNVACCKMHLQHGTTSIVPTLSTSGYDMYRTALKGVRETMKRIKGGPYIAGVHMEGPYLSPAQLGAQSPDFLKPPDERDYLSLFEDYPFILRWTIAPEVEGTLQMARKLIRRGVHFSIGHSDAMFDDVMRAYEIGVNCITHLYSATSTVRRINAYRYAGIIEAAYFLDGMTVEIIADGKHLPESLLKLIYKLKGAENICLVTDALGATGLPANIKEIYDASSKQVIIIEDGVAKLKDGKAFAGSVATSDRLVRNMVKLCGAPIVDAVKMMTYTPAKTVGIEKAKGSIASGMDADLVIFDKDIVVKKVIFAGELVS